MDAQLHVEVPSGVPLFNVTQRFGGWFAVRDGMRDAQLQFLVDGKPVDVTMGKRPDVEAIFAGMRVQGWSFLLTKDVLFQQPRRTLVLEARFGSNWTWTRTFCKSRHLMPAGRDSPLFFMHIPKTAGTALRHIVDYAFRDMPTLLVYGEGVGIGVGDVLTTYREFVRSRELLFGHYDVAFVRELQPDNPKVISTLRDPAELVRSYTDFNRTPQPRLLDNPLVRHFSGKSNVDPFGLIEEKHLHMALHNIEQHCHIVPSDGLQEFADELTTLFALPRYVVARVNETPPGSRHRHSDLPVDLRYDRQLYEICRARRRGRFADFLNA